MATMSSSFYEVLRSRLHSGCGRLPDFSTNNHLCNIKPSPPSSDPEHSSRGEFTVEGAVSRIRELGHSLVFDLSECYVANPANITHALPHLGATPSDSSCACLKLPMGDAQLFNLARAVADCDPVESGALLVVGATGVFRTKDSLHWRDTDSKSFYLTTDDAYIVVGLVPGEECDAVEAITINPRPSIVEKRLCGLVANVKYYLLAITDPTSYDMSWLDFHTLLVMYSAVLTTRTLAKAVIRGTITFESFGKRRLLELDVADGLIRDARCDMSRGLLSHFKSILLHQICEPDGFGGSTSTAMEDKSRLSNMLEREYCASYRTNRVMVADGSSSDVLSMHMFAIKIALVVAQVVEESKLSGRVDLSGIRNSKVISNFAKMVTEYCQVEFYGILCFLLEEFGNYVEVEGSKNMPSECRCPPTLTFNIRIGGVCCDLLKAMSTEEEKGAALSAELEGSECEKCEE